MVENQEMEVVEHDYIARHNEALAQTNLVWDAPKLLAVGLTDAPNHTATSLIDTTYWL